MCPRNIEVTKGVVMDAPDNLLDESSVIGCDAQDEVARPIREMLDRVGDKWSLLVIGVLREGPMRFGVIRENTAGISQRMLTLTLRKLERDGMVDRQAFAEVPPRVEYRLTPMGETLIEPVMGLVRWTLEHHVEIESSRESYDRAHDKGSAADRHGGR